MVKHTDIQKEKGTRFGRVGYAVTLLIYIVAYVGFFYYTKTNLEVIMDGFINLRMDTTIKITGLLSAFLILSWFGLMAGSIYRGRDIGFHKWVTFFLFFAPAIPRMFIMITGIGMSFLFGPELEIVSNVIQVIVSGVFLYLKTDWAYEEQAE